MAAPLLSRSTATLRGRGAVLVVSSPRLPSPVNGLANLAATHLVPIRHHRSLARPKAVVSAILLAGTPLRRTWGVQSGRTWLRGNTKALYCIQQRSVATKPDQRGEHESSSRSPTPNPPPHTTTTTTTRTNTTPLPPTKLLSRPHEYIWTVPNLLTFSRLFSAPLIGYFILTSHPLPALSLFVYAALTDGLDGYVARRFALQTVLGTVIDPMADKALMTITIVCLAVQHAIPPWLAVLILGRDVALSFTAFYYRWISLPPPKTMARYWDFSLPSAEVRPTEISKWNTFLQLLLVGAALTVPVLPEAVVAAWHVEHGLQGFQYVVAATTVWSGASYLYSKDAVKILTREEIGTRLREKEGKDRERGSWNEARK